MAVQSDWLEKDFYKVLGVSEDASEKDIAKAYRRLARQWHPDANPDSRAVAEERFKEISAAYDVLGDKAKRAEYDQLRHFGPVTAGAGDGFGTDGRFRVRFGNVDDFDDLGLGDLLGGLFGSASGRGRRSGSRGRRGVDLEAVVTLGFADAIRGVTTTVALTVEEPCEVCSGSGAAPGSTAKTCATCGGSGMVAADQGFFSLRQTCPVCNGAGSAPEKPCDACGGSGRQRRDRHIRVRMPAGISDGDRIRVPRRGGPGAAGGPAGDLYVAVRVAPHPVFGRAGNDLTVTVPIGVTEAVLGTELKVPTLDGEPVKVRVPAGTQPGQILRVRGHGVPAAGGRPAGDLLVSLQLVVPKHLSHKQRKAFQALAEVLPPPSRDHLEAG